MGWDTALPILNGTLGGFFMAIALWAIVTNKISLPREVVVYKSLYEAEKEERQKVDAQNDDLVADMRKSHDMLQETARALQNANALLTTLVERKESR
jgi:hypothetical protein